MKKLLKKIYEDVLDEQINENLKEDSEIIIINKKGEVRLEIKGNRIAILIALAGAKQQILQETECNEKIFHDIEERIYGKEIKRYE